MGYQSFPMSTLLVSIRPQIDYFCDDAAYLYLLKGDIKAKTFIKVGIERVFLDRRLLLLNAFSVLLQNNLHIWILWKKKRG